MVGGHGGNSCHINGGNFLKSIEEAAKTGVEFIGLSETMMNETSDTKAVLEVKSAH